MLKNDNINRVLAVIVAIVLWAYVVGEVNPVADTVIRNVPINFINQNTLEEEDLTILSSSATSVNISISGQRAEISKVEAGDFSVTCDVEGLKLGENTVRLNFSGPDDVKIENTSVEKVTVVVDERITAEKSVQIVINGESGTDKEPYIVQADTGAITVVGPKTSVNKVASMAAYLDVADISGEMKTFAVDAVPVDSLGVQVAGVEALNSSRVNVVAVMLTTKTVNLNVDVINEHADGIERTYSAPKTMVIKGTENSLKNINTIMCETVDLKDIVESTSVTLEPVLPEGIQVAEASKDLSMNVTVKAMDKKTFDFTSADIQIFGGTEELEYSIEDIKYTVEVIAKESIMSSLAASDFVISADVTGLKKGTHAVELTVTCSKSIQTMTVSPVSAEVTIA